MVFYDAAAHAASCPRWARVAPLAFARADGQLIELAPLNDSQRFERGITSAAYAEWLGIGNVTGAQHAALLGIKHAGAGVAIPTFTSLGVLWRVRLDKPKPATDRHKSQQRYNSPSKDAWPHGLPPFVVKHGRLDEWLIVVEGEFKCIALQQHLPNCQFVGLRGVHTCLTEAKQLNAFWGELLGDLRGRWALILFDSDIHTNAQVRAALLRLRDALIRAGCCVWVAVIPGPERQGPDEFLLRHGPDALRAILEARVPALLGERVALINTPAEASKLVDDPLFIDTMNRTRGEEWLWSQTRLRELGVTERVLSALRRRTTSKRELRDRVQLALQTDMPGASIRQVLAALRREDFSFNDHVVAATINELRAKGRVPPARSTRGAPRKPSISDEALDRELRDQVRVLGRAATVRHVLGVIKAKHGHVGTTRVCKRLAAVRAEASV